MKNSFGALMFVFCGLFMVLGVKLCDEKTTGKMLKVIINNLNDWKEIKDAITN